MSNPPNILQYEFFHVGGPGVSLKQVFAECAERACDSLELVMRGHESGTGIKTVIRIYDTDGKVTALANERKELETQNDKLFLMSRKWFIPPLIHSRLTGRKIGIIFSKLDEFRREIHLYAVDYLTRALHEPLSVAVKGDDYSFIEAQMDELHELAQSARVAKAFWLFVFEPNNLLAKENRGVVHVM